MQPRSKGMLRLLAVALVIVGSLTLAWKTGAFDEMSVENIRQTIGSFGALGPLVFIALFSVGHLLHIPGTVFISAGTIAFGAPWGGPLTVLAGTIAVSTNFVIMRSIGGDALMHLDSHWMRRALKLIDERPLLAVILLRVVMYTSPALSTALALTPVNFWRHLLGSAIGMSPAVLAISFTLEGLL